MKSLIVIVFFSALGLQSCFVENARVMTLKSNSPGIDSTFLYSNDSFLVQYNYYGEGLRLNMTIYNKLNKPLFIDWGQSSYIQGTQKYSYWNSATTLEFNREAQSATINQEDRYSNIPPRTSISTPAFYNSTPPVFVSTPLNIHFKRLKPSVKFVHHRNSDSFNVSEINFTPTNTPLIFRNYLTLSYDPKFNNQFYLDQQFWVSKEQDMDVNDFLGVNSYGSTTDPYKSNNCFFIRYDPRDYPFK